MSAEGLKPCDCGSGDVALMWAHRRTLARAQCFGCGACTAFYSGDAGAIAAWNRRALPTREELARAAWRKHMEKLHPDVEPLTDAELAVLMSDDSDDANQQIMTTIDAILALLNAPIPEGE